ncbi:MAG: serine hydrolase domain-containing protein, partial [Dehalococcoidia bacterium]
ASMTKVLAAHAALKLAEQGKLDLDKPLSSYLPAPYLPDEPQHEKITARVVLTHTTGLPNWRPKGGPLKVLHDPGTQFGYSGEGFLFLQRVIEQITGEDYEPFMQRMLLRPLGMKHSSHVWQEGFAATAAAGHDDSGRVKPDRKLYTKPNAAYTLYCTPRDYAAFVLDLINPDRGADHSLSAKSVRAMLPPASPPTDRTPLSRRGSTGATAPQFGLGWLIDPTASGERICHSGSNGTGFRSYVEFDPVKGHGIIIMTNSTGGDDLWRDLLGRIGVP